MSRHPAFVLVHGSFHGPWCWARLTPLLEAAGYAVATPDLASATGDPGLAAYTDVIGAAIERLGRPVVLVGHSMGGIVASQTAERYCDRVFAIVYVCGLLLPDGESLMSFLESDPVPGSEDLVLKTMQPSADGRVATFPAEVAAPIFYNCCETADAGWAARQLRPQPLAVYGDRLTLSEERFGRVPRRYVMTLRDRAVPPALQRAMTERTRCDETPTLNTDHSPFLSCPTELAAILLRMVE